VVWLISRSIGLKRRKNKKRRDNKDTMYRIWKEGYNCEKDVCYESPKKETVSHTFKHFIQNLKSNKGVKE